MGEPRVGDNPEAGEKMLAHAPEDECNHHDRRCSHHSIIHHHQNQFHHQHHRRRDVAMQQPNRRINVPAAAAAVRFCKASPVALFLPAIQQRESTARREKLPSKEAKKNCGGTCQSRRFRRVKLA